MPPPYALKGPEIMDNHKNHSSDLNTIASFEAERAGIFVLFGAQLNFERYYNAYQKHCEKKRLQPVSEEAFIPVSNRIISELREWWYTKEIGIYVVEEGNLE